MSANYSICIGTIGTGAWLSPDGGDSWRRIASPNGLWGESRVYGLATHPSEPRTIFAGADDGIYRSSDGGQSFTRLELSDELARGMEDRGRSDEPQHHFRRNAACRAVPLERRRP